MEMDCPKCGEGNWSAPKYEAKWHEWVWSPPIPPDTEGKLSRELSNEWLRFTCRVCGYSITRPCKDAEK